MCYLSKENKNSPTRVPQNEWRYIIITNVCFKVDRSLLKESKNIPLFLRTVFPPDQNKSMHLQRTYVTRSRQAEKARLH